MATSLHDSFDSLVFDNRFTRDLPADPQVGGRPRQVTGACYSRVNPTPVKAPSLVMHSPELAAELGWAEGLCTSDAFAEVFGGNRVLEGMDPHAMCYGGHQFGHWAGQLGDGRAINLGEVVAADGRTQMLQLKGAGPTPYSRQGDGLAVLRSSLREFVCSEAMHFLGVPTTRALSLVLTGEQVVRDMFYDGRPEYEPGAICCRVAPSFLRIGNYEYLAATEQKDLLRQLVDFTITTQFAHLLEGGDAAGDTAAPDADTYVAWFSEVCRRTADLVVHWQRVGFVHGVLNTDNLSVLGLTIDYGPYGWIDGFDPDWTPNTTDFQQRRYRWGQQPAVAQWNLAKLASALVPLVGAVEPLQAAIEVYGDRFSEGWQAMMGRKLGLATFDAEADVGLVEELFEIMRVVETDMTILFRRLGAVTQADAAAAADGAVLPWEDAFYTPADVTPELRARSAAWLQRYAARIAADGPIDDAARRARMDATNPKFIFRNYLAQTAIDAVAAGDDQPLRTLFDVLRRPYDEQPEHEDFAAKRPEWARDKPGCSTLSCSS